MTPMTARLVMAMAMAVTMLVGSDDTIKSVPSVCADYIFIGFVKHQGTTSSAQHRLEQLVSAPRETLQRWARRSLLIIFLLPYYVISIRAGQVRRQTRARQT